MMRRTVQVSMACLLAVGIGCGSEPPAPTPDQAPWLFPEKQIELLSSSDFRARALAARNLGKMGAKAEIAIDDLEKLQDDENARVRELAAEALEKIRKAVAESGSQ